jgi:MFS family permease
MGESDVLVLSTSIYIIGFISFMGDMARGVLFPVLWRLCQYLGGSTVELGYLVASFSFGRMVFGPYLGYVCDKYSSKKSLLIASFILMIGSILWAVSFSTGTIGTLFAAQFLLGCGSGSLGVTRAYVIDKCPKKRLTEVMAYMNALQFAGFTVSPILGSGLSELGATMGAFWTYFFPPLSITFASITSMYMIIVLLDDIAPTPAALLPETNSKPDIELAPVATMASIDSAAGSASSSDIEEGKTLQMGRTISTQKLIVDSSSSSSFTAEGALSVPPSTTATVLGVGEKMCCFISMSDTTAVYIALIAINVIARGSIAVYETLSSQVSNDLYGMSTVTLGMIISSAGIAGTLQLIFFKAIWGKSGLSDTHMMFIGTIVMAAASLVIFDYEHELVRKYFDMLLIDFNMLLFLFDNVITSSALIVHYCWCDI